MSMRRSHRLATVHQREFDELVDQLHQLQATEAHAAAGQVVIRQQIEAVLDRATDEPPQDWWQR